MLGMLLFQQIEISHHSINLIDMKWVKQSSAAECNVEHNPRFSILFSFFPESKSSFRNLLGRKTITCPNRISQRSRIGYQNLCALFGYRSHEPHREYSSVFAQPKSCGTNKTMILSTTKRISPFPLIICFQKSLTF